MLSLLVCFFCQNVSNSVSTARVQHCSCVESDSKLYLRPLAQELHRMCPVHELTKRLLCAALIYRNDSKVTSPSRCFRSAGTRHAAARQLPTDPGTDSHVSPGRVDGAQVHEAQAAVLLQRRHDALQSGPHAPVFLHVLWGEPSAWR